MPDLCPTCHNAGRSLWNNSCLCTGDAMLPTVFHAWSAKNRVPYNIPQPKIEAPKVVVSKPKMVFGQGIPKKI
jgi:hypothetical protein